MVCFVLKCAASSGNSYVLICLIFIFTKIFFVIPSLLLFFVMFRKFVIRLLKYPVERGETLNLFEILISHDCVFIIVLLTFTPSHRFRTSKIIWNSSKQCVNMRHHYAHRKLIHGRIVWESCECFVFRDSIGRRRREIERYKRLKGIKSGNFNPHSLLIFYSNWFHHHSSSLFYHFNLFK